MPSAQPITMISTTKPKIGFSIDSIVGNHDFHDDSNEAKDENLLKMPTDLQRQYSHLIKLARENSPTDNKTISRLSESSDQDIRNNNNQSLKSRSPSPSNKAPIVVPGIPAGLMNRPPMLGHGQHFPPYAELPPGHPHFLQFQAAAAFVHAQASQTGFSGNPLPQHLQHLHNPNMHRDSYQLYPWLLSRHGRIFPHRFPGSECFFLFRKRPFIYD